jgi:putative tricarboxylic transport membrane protein
MGKIDVICGLIIGAFSLLFYIGTLSFPDMSIGINPRAYPMVIIVASFGLSVLLVVQGTLKMRQQRLHAQASGEQTAAPARTLPRGKTAWFLVTLAAAMLAYALTMEDLGYIMVTPPLAALAMWFFGERKPLKIALVSILIALALYWIFRGLFRVPLPRSFIW